MRYNRNVFINLLCFNSPKIGGAGYYFKRLFGSLSLCEGFKDIFFYVIIQKGLGIQNFFEINGYENVHIIEIPFIKNNVLRILYEQIIMPYIIPSECAIYYNPNPSVPVNFRRRGIKYICTVHDLIPFFVKEKSSMIKRVYNKFIIKAAINNSDILIAVSENTKNDIYKMFGRKDGVSVVYNFINKSVQNCDIIYEKYFLTVSTVHPGKNIKNCILAFDAFNKAFGNGKYRYVIVGAFGYKSMDIVRMVEELGLEKYIQFTGYINDNELNKYNTSCLGLLYLSLYEGFGIPPLEGMYYKKSTIGSNISSIPEVIGETGYLVDPMSINDIVAAMISMAENPRRYIDNMAIQIKKFTAFENSNKFMNLLV